MLRTASLDREIGQTKNELAQEQAVVARAASDLAQDPTNLELRRNVVLRQQAVADIQASIDALNAARAEAEKFDQSDAVKAQRKARVEAVKTIQKTQDDIVKAATDVDAAVAALAGKMEKLSQAREAAKQAAFDYRDLNETEFDTRSHHVELLVRTPNEMAVAVYLALHKIATASGLNLGEYVTFNLFALTADAGVGKVLDKPIADAAASNAERVIKVVDGIESLHRG